jgi:protein-disulfide isomerase
MKKYFSIMMIGSLFLMNSCMDFSTEGKQSVEVDLAPLIAKQELFEKKLNQIVKKIDALQASVKNISTAPSKADNKPKQNKRKPADPNYAHNIPQGNSFFIGNPNAKVTITEFFDFQ